MIEAEQIIINIVNHKIPLTEAQIKERESIWQQSKINSGKVLFNGKILSVLNLEKKDKIIELNCFWDEYKTLFYQNYKKEKLITTIGINGIVRNRDQYLIGCRSNFVNLYPGKWEFAPAGSLNLEEQQDSEVDIIHSVLLELIEETSLKKEDITGKKILGLVFDGKCFGYDIAVQLETDKKEVIPISNEYTELKWVKPIHILENREMFIPTAIEISIFLKNL